MIVVGGSARSGTTMIGKIIHSMEGVEYFYEPPLLTPILLKSDELTIDSLRELIGFYLYDSLFLDSLAGRNINLNKNDDSSIYNVKEIEEIQTRLKKSYSRIELEELSRLSTLSFKLPEIVFFLDLLRTMYPPFKLVLMHRNINDITNSIIKKKWFSDEFLDESHDSQIYAVNTLNGVKIPFWVQEEDINFWLNANEINRCAYYCLKISEATLKHSNNAIIFDYDTFIVNPIEKTQYLANKLGLNITDNTRQMLSSVNYRDKKRKLFVNEINKSISDQIEAINSSIVELAV